MLPARSPVTFDVETGAFIFDCPHCGISVLVQQNDLACQIFRCGTSKATGEPIPPHLSQATGEELVRANLIFGCAQPFRFVMGPSLGESHVEVCDYI